MTTRFKNQTTLLTDTNKSILILWVWWVWSMAAFVLAKMWFNDITIVDWDDVEDHNVASQMYKETQLGQSKIVSLADNIREFSWVEIKPHHDWWEAGKFPHHYDIIICAIDNMEIRKDVVDYHKDDLWTLIIEARMSGRDYVIYSFNPLEKYYEWLANWFPTSESTPWICTEKSICFNTMQIGWEIWAIVRNHVMWEEVSFITQKWLFNS